jgi:hypothetical protein
MAFAGNRSLALGGDCDIFKMTVSDNGPVLGLIQLTTSTAQDRQPTDRPTVAR